MTAPTSLADAVAEAAAGMTKAPWRVAPGNWEFHPRIVTANNRQPFATDADDDPNLAGIVFFRNHADEIARRLREGEAALALVAELEADLSAIYGRMRHTHPDSVSCADAGPKGHPPQFQPAIGWGHSGPCARPSCDCDANTAVRRALLSGADQ